MKLKTTFMSVCINHPDRSGTSRCSTCHKPICSDCVVKLSGSVFCSQICHDNAARFNANFKPDHGPGFFGRLKNTIVSFVGMAAVAAVVVVILAKVLKIDFFINLLKKVGL
jgi:hypothetical protein